MPSAAVSTAMCRCSFGVAPSTILAMSSTDVLADGKPMLTVVDKTNASIPTFGMCTTITNPTVASATAAALGVLTPMPCIPVLPASWMPGKADVLIGGKRAVCVNDTLNCAYGGVISIINAGQTEVQV